MKVLIACEFSGVVREAFTKRGHDATSCDYLASDQPFGKHYQGDMFQIAYGHWDLIIAHPPCTDLAVSGSKYWAEKVKDGRQGRAIEFVERIWQLPCLRICIENPVGALSTRSKLGKPAQYIHPYQFGHPEAKRLAYGSRIYHHSYLPTSWSYPSVATGTTKHPAVKTSSAHQKIVGSYVLQRIRA